MIVLKEHRAVLTWDEQAELEVLRLKHFPYYRPRGIGVRSNPEHFHEHYIALEV